MTNKDNDAQAYRFELRAGGVDTGWYLTEDGERRFIENGTDVRADTDPVLLAAMELAQEIEIADDGRPDVPVTAIFVHKGMAHVRGVVDKTFKLRDAILASKRCAELKEKP